MKEIEDLLVKMEKHWNELGVIGREERLGQVEPFSESCCIEVALNELIDYAMRRGYAVRLTPDSDQIVDLVVK